jgi:hypothetical protein
MQQYKLKWYERFQIEIGISWKMVRNRDMSSWKEWAFSPSFGMTVPGQEIKNRWQLPESSSWGVDTISVGEQDKKYISSVLWVHGALRVLGLDIGAGVFWRKQQKLELK